MSIKKSKYTLTYVEKKDIAFKEDRAVQIFLAIYGITFSVLAIRPVSRFQWIYGNLVSVLSLLVLAFMYKKNRLTNKSYISILTMLLLNTIGSHYTYSLCPIGKWMISVFGFKRNYYDRLVCFAFGMLISYPVMEAIYKRTRVKYIQACMLSIAIILALGALYEIQEMFCTMFFNLPAKEIFDAQKDMFMSLLGVCSSIGIRIFYNIKTNRNIRVVKA